MTDFTFILKKKRKGTEKRTRYRALSTTPLSHFIHTKGTLFAVSLCAAKKFRSCCLDGDLRPERWWSSPNSTPRRGDPPFRDDKYCTEIRHSFADVRTQNPPLGEAPITSFSTEDCETNSTIALATSVSSSTMSLQ